ncbi:hypothetical protein JB92DRAFT_938417 [Gautieria morchelliformis]|nr:hypothetical protein JB92DRAFT_938417 [Gautieria morchelliformis]
MAGAYQFNPDKRLLNPREVLIICSSLVTISEESTENTGRSLPHITNWEQVRLVHFSVKEYLTLEHVLGGCASIFYFNQHMADTFIAEPCLAYLLQFDEPFYNHEHIPNCRHSKFQKSKTICLFIRHYSTTL